MLLRVKGNWIELTGNILTTHDFGTPGAANSRAAANAGPAITDVTHGPILPARNEAATVSAQIHDPDGLFAATLYYRVDPSTAYRVAGLTPRGAGLYAADIPGLATNGHVAFYIEATDLAGATVRFPDDAPVREGLVRFGEGTPSVDLGIYRLWFTWATEAYWRTREKNSNKPLDATFVYGGHRVIYNMNTLYSGSPFHSKGYSGPLGASCDYVANFPRDEMLLGEEDFVLAINGDGSSGVREPTAYWMLRFLGVPYNYKRFVHLYVNGVRRAFPTEPFYEDVQQPNASVVEEWFPDDSEGDLLKIEDWFEFDDAGSNFVNEDARLQKYTTTGGALKTARYRWNWRKRAIRGEFSNYTNLYELVENANMTSHPAYAERMDRLLDEDNWIRIVMTEHFVGNFDSYGYNRGKNMYAYKPEHDPWHLLPWDIEFGFGYSGGDTDTSITPESMPVDDPVIRFFLRHPPFVREWWRAAAELCEDVIGANPTRLANMQNSRYSAFTNDLARIGSYTLNTRPSTILTWIMARRAFTMASYQAVASSPFAVTTGGGASFSTNANLVRLSGTAPFQIETLWVNGIEREVTWTTVTNWQFDVVLNARTNALVIEGLTKDGTVFGGLPPGVLDEVLAKGRPQLLRHDGRATFVEPVRPLPRLIVAGAGHIGRAVARLGRLLDFSVTVIDDRAEFANAANVPDAAEIVVGGIGESVRAVGDAPDNYFVIVTRGHSKDAEALRAALGRPAAYVGMIGSRTKIGLMRREFLESGWATAEEWDRVRAPIGLDIGSKTVEEIAVSIAAELVRVRAGRRGPGRP